MKSPVRNKAHRLWRSSEKGLVKLLGHIDKIVTDTEALNFVNSELFDRRLKLNRELRENAAFELRWRREDLENQDRDDGNSETDKANPGLELQSQGATGDQGAPGGAQDTVTDEVPGTETGTPQTHGEGTEGL
jgi:hypothetical protein